MELRPYLELTKKLIRSAAEIGIDEAGVRLCGSLWPQMKKLLTPVMETLDQRFPQLTLAPSPKRAEAAEQAARALDEDLTLQAKISESLERLTEGQTAMHDLLSQSQSNIAAMSKAVHRYGTHSESRLEEILGRMAGIETRLDLAMASRDVAAGLTPGELLEDLDDCNRNALDLANAGDEDGARRRLARGRRLAESALLSSPSNPGISVRLGYVEKTQGQLDINDYPVLAEVALSRAMACFQTSAQADDDNLRLSALNGLAIVYRLHGDLNRAISLGEALFRDAPDYGAAMADYASALEDKLELEGLDRALQRRLVKIYEHIETLLDDPGQMFSAVDADDLRKRALRARAPPSHKLPTKLVIARGRVVRPSSKARGRP